MTAEILSAARQWLGTMAGDCASGLRGRSGRFRLGVAWGGRGAFTSNLWGQLGRSLWRTRRIGSLVAAALAATGYGCCVGHSMRRANGVPADRICSIGLHRRLQLGTWPCPSPVVCVLQSHGGCAMSRLLDRGRVFNAGGDYTKVSIHRLELSAGLMRRMQALLIRCEIDAKKMGAHVTGHLAKNYQHGQGDR